MLSKEYKFYLFCRYHMQRIKDKNTVVYSWFQYIQNVLHIKATIAEQIVIKSLIPARTKLVAVGQPEERTTTV